MSLTTLLKWHVRYHAQWAGVWGWASEQEFFAWWFAKHWHNTRKRNPRPTSYDHPSPDNIKLDEPGNTKFKQHPSQWLCSFYSNQVGFFRERSCVTNLLISITFSTTSKIAPEGPVSWYREDMSIKKSTMREVLSILRHCLRILFLCVAALAFLALASVLILLLILSMSSTATYGCGGVSTMYPHLGSPYYSSSFVSKVFEIIKPYCNIEYHSGCPPV